MAKRHSEGLVLSDRRSRRVALVASFGALYAVLRLITLPFPVLGGGVTFPVADVAASLYGLLLGPLAGGLGVVLGTFLGFALGRPVLFAFLDFLPATVNAVGVGLAVRGRASWSASLFVVLLVLFTLHPLALPLVDLGPALPGVVVPFNWLHFVALALLVSPLRTRAITALRGRGTGMSWAVAFLNFVGTMMQHVTGGLLFAAIRGSLLGAVPPAAFPAVWTAIFWAYPGERAVIIALATVAAVPVLRSLLRAGLLVSVAFPKESATTACYPADSHPPLPVLEFVQVINAKTKQFGDLVLHTISRGAFEPTVLAALYGLSDGIIEMRAEEAEDGVRTDLRVTKMPGLIHSTRWVPYLIDPLVSVVPAPTR